MKEKTHLQYMATEADVGEVVDNLLQEKSWEYAAILKGLPAGAAKSEIPIWPMIRRGI